MNSNSHLRHWTIISLAALSASPALVLRLLEITGTADPHLGNVGQSLLFGLGIMAAGQPQAGDPPDRAPP